MKFGIGQTVKRLEDRNLLTGKGAFTDDQMPGKGRAVAFLRAPFAHARITHLDLAAARGCDGVVLAACQADLDADNVGEIHCLFYPENRDGSKVAHTTKPPMARDIVRHAGDLVAMVVAETRQQAMDALDMIEVDYDPLDAVTDVYDAMAADAPQIHSEYKNNIVFDWEAGAIDKARTAIDDAVAKGAELVEIDLINSRVMPNAMETRPVVAMPCEEIGGLRLWLPSQGPVGLAEQIADALGYQKDQLQVLTGDVGGGFGYKIFLHPEQLCIAWAAKTTNSLVRWQQDRSDSFLSDLHGRDNRSVARAAVDKNGKVLALDVRVHANMGSWLSNFSCYIPTLSGCRTLTGPYDIQIAGMQVLGIVTNTPAVDAFRGAGRPEANYLLERLMDHIAVQMKLDRIAVRQANLIQPEQIPYAMVEGGTVDSGDMPGLLADAMEKADWQGFEARRKQARANGKYLGIGLAMYLEQCGGGGDAGVDVEFQADGTAVIYASQQDNGQAHRTTLTQIFSHQLGYDVDKIKIVQGDSLRTPAGTTGGARMSAVMGSTLSQAADLIAEKARPFAAEHLEANSEDIQFAEGIFSAAGTNRSIEIEELVGLLATDNPAEHPLNQVHEYTTKGASYPYGCHIVELEVDMATLQPKILRYTVVDDIGNIINPLTFAGQIHGGIAQGVGQALYEHVAFDEDGQLLAGSLMDYTLPRADHLPSFSINTRNTVCQNNVLGVKGVGEAGAIGAPPAVISALCDALDIVHIEMPATLQAIWQVMKPKKEAG
ncbi:MAG: xanthine dehydrogenase family protein molybdopterin-binding subunit [Candidatus Puniceispirillaceae bacterium]